MDKVEWLPLAEYAMKTGTSISTLRRRIKARSLRFRLEEGKYLIALDARDSEVAVPQESHKPEKINTDIAARPINLGTGGADLNDLMDLRWKALEARVVGLARKLDLLAEQNAELKMLVKIFEERLEGTR